MRSLHSIIVTVMISWFTLIGLQAYAAPPAEAFGKLPAIYDAALSPDASKIAIIVNYKGEYVLSLIHI